MLNKINVEGIDLIGFDLCFKRRVCLVDRHLGGYQSEPFRNTFYVSINRQCRSAKGEQQHDCCCLWTNAWERLEPCFCLVKW